MKQRIPPQPLRVPDPPDTNAPGDGLVAHVYRPSVRNHRSERGIVVLPIQGGDYEVSTLFADFFSDRGYNVLRFERRAEWLEAEQDPEVLGQLIPAFRQNIVDGV